MNPQLTEQTAEQADAAADDETQRANIARPAPQLTLVPEDIPNLDHIVTEDEIPVDNIFVEKQQRLLAEALYTSWPGPRDGRSFLALANVGMFYALHEQPLVPDVMLSLGVRAGADLSKKENRSYFIWVMGKHPDVVIEIVSDRYGEEDSRKM